MIDSLPLAIAWDAAPGIHPALLFFGAAILLLLCRGNAVLQGVLLIATPIIGALNLLTLEMGSSWTWQVLDLSLVQLRVDRLSFLFGLLFHLALLLGAIYALRVRDTMQHVATLTYAGSALGAVFAGDLITLFIYWEGMALASAILVWANRTSAARAAGMRYLVLQLASGLLLLAGTAMIYQASGSIEFDLIGAHSLAGWLILLAFGIKCGFPLLHGWIIEGYPASTPSGTVFLSMFTTKVAVYALARGFAGTEILVTIGTVMALFPIFYAVIENDLRRVLGYSMINQIGFMVVGVGVGTELALNGTVAHAFNEVLFKGLLFMTMGAVLYRVRHVLGSDLGGLYKSMPLTTLCCVVGAASISAFPLFNGFVSKSMIMSAMIEQGHNLAWLGLLFASAGVFHHAGIKIPYFAFFSHDSGLRVKEAPGNMLLAMVTAAVLCIVIGSFPGLLYQLLPWQAEYVPYTYPHVIVQVQILLFSALAFAWLKLTGIYPPELRSVNLDVDWLYRVPLRRFLQSMFGGFLTICGQCNQIWQRTLHSGSVLVHGVLAKSTHSGVALLLVGILLVAYMVLYYFNV